MGSPLADRGSDRVHDLGFEIEAEVVARGEVGEPVIADPDAPAFHLVDHSVVER
jgi:hypothetical protein